MSAPQLQIGESAKVDGQEKYWSGENYEWQSKEQYDKLEQEGKFKTGTQALDRLQSSAVNAIGEENLAKMGQGFGFVFGNLEKVMKFNPSLSGLYTAQNNIGKLTDQASGAASDALNVDKRITDTAAVAAEAFLTGGGPGAARRAGGKIMQAVDDLIPQRQLQFSLAGATNTGSVVRQQMDELTPPTVMKYTDEQLDTLGDVGKNKEFLDTLDPKYRYFTPEALQEAQEQMVKREGPLRTAEDKLQDYKDKVAKAEAEGNQKNLDKYSDKERKLDRKVSDYTAGPTEDVVPDNPQTYWSTSQDAKDWRQSAGVDAEGNPRVDSHHQTIESMETAAIFRRMKVVKQNPQASLIIWEHMRRLGIVPGPGRRAQRMVSKPEHTLAKDSLHVAVLNKYRGFFKNLPEDISLNDLLGKIDEFAASLDDSDKFYLKKGMPPIDRDIPAGRLMENQTERAIRDVQNN